MRLNPFYYLRQYRKQKIQIDTLEKRNAYLESENQALENRNKELNGKLKTVRQALREFEQDFAFVVSQKQLSRKQAKELRNKHRGNNGKPSLQR